MTIPPLEAELVHTNGRTETTILIVFFRNFANTLNKTRERYFEEVVRGLILDPVPVLP